jgi:hypothetical protein
MPDIEDKEVAGLLDRYPQWTPIFSEPSELDPQSRLRGVRMPGDIFVPIEDLISFIKCLR